MRSWESNLRELDEALAELTGRMGGHCRLLVQTTQRHDEDDRRKFSALLFADCLIHGAYTAEIFGRRIPTWMFPRFGNAIDQSVPAIGACKATVLGLMGKTGRLH
jgi:hypothetical protein